MFLFLCLLSPGHAADREVTLQWDKSIDDPYLQSYKVYYYTAPGSPETLAAADYASAYTLAVGDAVPLDPLTDPKPITIDKENTQITLHALDGDKDYYFVVTAVDTRALEGVPTPEISIMKMRVAKAGMGTGAVTASPSGIRSEINCGTACSADYIGGTTVTLNATYDPENVFFIGWSGIGGACPGTAPCVLTVIPGLDITATFLPILQVAKADTGTGKGTVIGSPSGVNKSINCGTTCTSDWAAYTDAAAVTLTATADAGNVFMAWSDACTGAGPCIVTMSEPKRVNAEFRPLRRLSLTKTGTGRGSVIDDRPSLGVNSNIDCGTGCSFDTADYAHQTVEENVKVTLTAVPNAGNTFTGWSGACSGTGSSCTVTMDAAKSVTANFIPFLRLTVKKDGAGTVSGSLPGIDCGADCDEVSADYSINTPVTLTAIPDPENNFAGWSGSGVCSGTALQCVVNLLEAASAIATFVKQGDVNRDGAANLADAILILQALSRKQPAAIIDHVADANGDGKLGLGDAIYLLQKGAGLR